MFLMFARLAAVSVSSSELVRSSTNARPRSESASSTPSASEQRRQGSRVGIANANELGRQGRQVRHGLAVLHLGLLGGNDLRGRRHHQYVAGLTLPQALDGQDQMQRLVPRHVDKPQRDAAGDAVRGDQVQAGDVSDDLQCAAHFHVLKVERQRLADVLPGRRRAFRLQLACGPRRPPP